MRIPKPKPIPEITPNEKIKEDLDLIVDGIDLQASIEKVVSATIIKGLSRPVPIKLDVSSEMIIDQIRLHFSETVKLELDRYRKQIRKEIQDQNETMMDRIRHNKGVWISDKIFWIWIIATSVMSVMSVCFIFLWIKIKFY